mmetsp:Transcript_21017/g.30795  ORF Transcript_21017/g.30795 Transcript_21017/m.30795 type:complete len:81 (-) Transcript_21017:1226-1468(-)
MEESLDFATGTFAMGCTHVAGRLKRILKNIRRITKDFFRDVGDLLSVATGLAEIAGLLFSASSFGVRAEIIIWPTQLYVL